MQVKDLGNMLVGSEISCCKQKEIVSESIYEPSFDVMSSFQHDLDLTLESPSLTTKDDFGCLI